MPQYQGVWTLEQQAQAQSNQQWVTDPNFKNTTLLLQADGTGSGSQNQTFLDGSTNNFFITRNGNTTQGSFSPFSQAPGYWGNYFDGTDDFYTSSTALFNYTTGNAATQTATIEAFVYITAFQSAPANIWENPCIAGKGDTYMNFGVNASGNLFIYHYDGTARTTTSSGTLSANTWNHVAVVISGGTITLYINGTSSGSGTWYGIDAGGQNSTSYFGETPDADSRAWLGYISNLRVSTTARTITVPTSPYVNEGNTAFLTFQSNRVVDNSSNAYAITASGTPSVQAFGPFAPALQWTPDVVGGSGYFDGTGDYLSAPNSAVYNVGAGSFSIEMWINTSSSSQQGLFTWSVANTGFEMAVNTTSGQVDISLGNGTTWILSNQVVGAVSLNTWNHIAWVRSSGTMSVFINGTRTYTVANSTTVGNPNTTAVIGSNRGTAIFFIGYISNFRFINGTPPYSPSASTITVPTAPLTTTGYGTTSQSITAANVSLLTNMTNAGIYDGKMVNNLETVGNAQVATSPVKYGSGSIAFDGTGDNLYTPNACVPATGDFTLEMWIYPTSTSGYQIIYSQFINGNTGSFQLVWNDVASKFTMNNGTGVFLTSSSTYSTNAWYHFAIVRTGSIFTMYVNGIAVASGTDSYSILQTATYIGTRSLLNGYFYGYIDDLRITRVARYFTTFTPPQQALPRQ